MSTAGHPAARTDVVVRRAEPHEYAEVGRVTQHGFDTGPYGTTSDADRLALLHDAAGRARDGVLLVAVSADGAILGTASLLRHGTPYVRNARADEAELRLLAVVPSGRGQGVGGRIIEAAIDEARAWAVDAVVLDTGPDNPAVGLYERLGFVRRPERETTVVRGIGRLRFYAFALVGSALGGHT